MHRSWLKSEAQRKKKALASGGRIPYEKRTFERYVALQAKRNLDSHGQAAVDDAVDMELDADDGDEYVLGDEIGFDKDDPEERAAYGAGEGSSSSGSDDDDDDDEHGEGDDDENGNLDNLALRLEKADEKSTLLHTKHHALLDGPKKNKALGELYETLVDVINLAQSKPVEKNVVAVESALEQLATAVETHLAANKPVRKTAPGVPERAPVPVPAGVPHALAMVAATIAASKAAIESVASEAAVARHAAAATGKKISMGIDLDALGADERIVLEGFNPGVPVEVTTRLLESLVASINAFIGNAHHIPGLDTPKASQFLALARARLAQMVDTNIAVKGRINAEKLETWLKVQQSLIVYLNKAMNQPAVVAASPPRTEVPPAAVDIIDVDADAGNDGGGGDNNNNDDDDDVDDGEEQRRMDIADDAAQEELEAAEELEQAGAAEAEAAASSGDQEEEPQQQEDDQPASGEDNDNDDAGDNGGEKATTTNTAAAPAVADAAEAPAVYADDEPDSGVAGSAEEATKDRGPIQNVHAAPMAIPSRTDSLDVIDPPTPAAPHLPSGATNGKAATAASSEPTMAVVAVKLTNRPIFLLGSNEEQLKSDALKRSSGIPTNMSLDDFFKANYAIRRLPLDWKHIVETDLKLRPVASSLYGKPEAKIWKQKQ